MDRRSYSVSRDEKSSESVYFEYDKVDGYQVNPKIKKKGSIEVSKIVFVNDSMSEKIIRRKIDKRIESLLLQLKVIEENNGDDEDGVRRSLMDAEKLKVQIINNYIKYLGNTYGSLTLKKIQIIINQLRYKLYEINDLKRRDLFMREMFLQREEETKDYGEREGRKGR